MLTTLVSAALILATVSAAEEQAESHPKGAIYGTVFDEHGKPAKGVWLTAWPDGPLGTILPQTQANEGGKYRFENLPWWGKYSVSSEDSPDTPTSSRILRATTLRESNSLRSIPKQK